MPPKPEAPTQPGVLTSCCFACAQYQHNRQSIAQSVQGPCGPQIGPLVGAVACGDECTLSQLPGAVPVAYKVTYTPPAEPSQVRAALLPASSVDAASDPDVLFLAIRAEQAVKTVCRDEPARAGATCRVAAGAAAVRVLGSANVMWL